MSDPFSLDPKIAADSLPLASLALSELRLMNDARHPWLLLVPRKAGAEEITDLAADQRATLVEEIATVSAALKTITACHKLNVAALGNIVRQLHVHVIARFPTDPAWPGPVWGVGKAVAYEAAERDKLSQRIRAALPA